jgi:hypothetical protein
MKSKDNRLLTALIGGLGTVAGAFAKQPGISVPAAWFAFSISATAIALDTFEDLDHPEPIKPAPVQTKPIESGIILKIPVGSQIKIEN